MYENKYLGSLREIMKSFNEQIEKVNLINQSIELVNVDIRRNGNVSDDQIRVWYQEDYINRNNLIPFEKYKEDIMKSLNQKKEQLQNELDSKNNEYHSALKELKTIKENAKREILKKRNELELLLSEKTMGSSEIASETDEIKAALSELSNMLNRVDNIDANLLEEINEELTNSEYELLLDMYNDGLERLYDLQEQVEKGEIEYSEYEKFANYMIERYDYMKALTASLKNPNSPYSNLSSEELTVQGNILRNRLEKLRDNKESEIAEYLQNELLRRPGYVGYEDLRKQLENEYLKKEKEIENEIEEIERYQSLGELIEPRLILRPKKENDFIVDSDVDEYNLLLEMYYEDWDRYGELQEKMQKNEIEYSEYEKFANYMSERYHYMMKLYNELKNKKQPYSDLSIEEIQIKLKELEEEFNAEYQYRVHGENGTNEHDDDFITEYNSKKKALEDELKRKNNPFANLTDEELQNKLRELEAEFNEEYYYRTHRENGLIEHDDNYLQDLEDKIKRIKEEIERRKDLNDLEKPLDPGFVGKIKGDDEEEKIPDPEPEPELANVLDARKILILLKGKDTDYKLGDNFAMKYKNVKIFGWKKYKERTILDKPIRLVKVGVGGVLFKLPSWAIAKANYFFNKRLQDLQKRVDRLSSEQLDVLIDYGISELKKFMPHEAILTALLPRLNQRLNERLILNNNIMAKMRTNLIELYIQAQEIKNKLSSEELTEEEKRNLESQFKSLSDQLFGLVLNIEKLMDATDELVNPARLGDSFAISKNLRDGGFYGKNAINHDADTVDLVIGDRLEKAKDNRDGFAAAEALIARDKLDKDNMIIKRTLRNKLGKTSVGSRYFAPFVEMEDYEKNPYLSNVLQTALILTTVTNLFRQINLQNELDAYRDIIAKQNDLIENFQAKYALLEKKALSALDPAAQQAFADDLRVLAETQAGYVQGICEDFAQKSAAGILGKSNPIIDSSVAEYEKLDSLAHNATGKFISSIQNVSTTLSPAEQVKQINDILADMQSFMADFTVKSFSGVNAYMTAKAGFNFTAEKVFAESITKANPALAVNLQYKLLDLAQGVIDLPTITTIQNLTANADVAGALTVLCGVLGKDIVEDQLRSDLTNGTFASNAQLTDEYAKKLDTVKLEDELEAEKIYDKKLEEFDSKGKLKKWLDRKNTPTKTSALREILEKESDEIIAEYERGLR